MNLFFKALSARKMSSKGFTLIELLVVIGILGILAAALIATIDPFEQLNKANDANVKNTAVEFVNANVRYFTTHSQMPWEADTVCSGGTAPVAQNLGTSNVNACLTDLVADGEIKAAFTTATGILSSIIVSGGGVGTDSVTACYLPVSKSGKRDANARYNASGALTTGCLSQTSAGTACYWCSL